MANITLLGASYTDVPAVDLPQTGGGTVRFYENGGGTPAISVVDTTDSHGGTVRTITALDISDTTAVASDVAQGKYFYTAAGVKTAGTGSGGTPSATQHEIYFEFSDSTDATITAYYDSTFISDAITATTPTTYGGKTVDSASLDGVTWYTRPTETWETLFDGNTNLNADTPYPSWWITDLSSVTIALNSTWRITIDGSPYRLVAAYADSTYGPVIGNPLYMGATDDGSGVPFCMMHTQYGAWSGGADLATGSHVVKIERLVTS